MENPQKKNSVVVKIVLTGGLISAIVSMCTMIQGCALDVVDGSRGLHFEVFMPYEDSQNDEEGTTGNFDGDGEVSGDDRADGEGYSEERNADLVRGNVSADDGISGGYREAPDAEYPWYYSSDK